MRSTRCLIVLGLVGGALGACERRDSTVGDASLTSAPRAAGEQSLEPSPAPRADAGPVEVAPVAPAGGADAGAGANAATPAWVPKNAALTIVAARDRDRNLGVVAPATTAVAVDAGSCEIGIEVRPRP